MRGGKAKKAAPKPPAKTPAKGGKSAEETKVADFSGMYKMYALDGGTIGSEGIMKICKDMHIDIAADAEILVFMFMAGCKEYGKITEEEFRKVGERMHVTKSLSDRTQYLSDFLKDPKDSEFKEFYKWLWTFHKEPISKSIDKDAAVTIMQMVIGKHFGLSKKLGRYLLEVRDDVKGITKDQWVNMFDFCKTINADLSNYNDLSAWPLILDEFCEWT